MNTHEKLAYLIQVFKEVRHVYPIYERIYTILINDENVQDRRIDACYNLVLENFTRMRDLSIKKEHSILLDKLNDIRLAEVHEKKQDEKDMILLLNEL